MHDITSSKLEPYGILNTPPEEEFDAITGLLANITNAPMAFLNLVEGEHHFFKSSHGAGGMRYLQDPRSFCNYTITQEGDYFEVPNAAIDNRFKDNPLVKDAPYVRSYFGIPLRPSELEEGSEPLGTLCILDTTPRTLTEKERSAMNFLAEYACRILSLRRERLELADKSTELALSNDELRAYSHKVAHDIKGPLAIISSFISLVSTEAKDRLNDQDKVYLNHVSKALGQLGNYTEELLARSEGKQASRYRDGDLELPWQILIETLQNRSEEKKEEALKKVTS